MQSEIGEWLVNNIALTTVLLMMVMVLIMACYIRRYVRIFSPEIHVLHYRKGKLFREYRNGGRVVMMPFFDDLRAHVDASKEVPEFLDDFQI